MLHIKTINTEIKNDKDKSRGESENGLSASFTYVHLDLFRFHPSKCKLNFLMAMATMHQYLLLQKKM